MATKPISKKLTLEQAIEATLKPIKREGDLICIQVDSRFGSPYAGMTDLAGNKFPAGEMRAIFLPSLDRSIREFKQPDTENHLRTMYEEGGYLESLERFTDEALALYFGYMAGLITESGLAGDVGDPSQFEADVLEALSRSPKLTPEGFQSLRNAILSQHKKYKLSANKGEKFVEGRRAGAKAATTVYIEELNKKHPEVTAKDLYKIAIKEAEEADRFPFSPEDGELYDREKDKIFPFKTFENCLSKIRNPKPKNPRTR